MYKVFINDKPLIISSIPIKDIKNTLFTHSSQFDTAVEELESTVVEGINIFHQDYQNLWKKFIAHFKNIEAAGGIVQNTKGELLFIKRWGIWDLPKGKMEEGETKQESAIREIEEECGITPLILNKFITTTYHIYFHEKYILKTTYWYDVLYKGKANPKPQEEEGIELVTWKKEKEIPELMQNTYANIKLLINEYLKGKS